MSDASPEMRWLKILGGTASKRPDRLRAYTSRMKVSFLDIGKGSVKAKLGPEGHKPFFVKFRVPVFGDAEWERALSAMAGEAFYAAKLLAGEFPDGLEEVFAQAGLRLFPEDVEASCSCESASRPCRHIACVHVLFARRLVRDPFLILELRGRSRGEILNAVRAPAVPATGSSPAEMPDAGPARSGARKKTGCRSYPDPDEFWRARGSPEGLADRILESVRDEGDLVKNYGLSSISVRGRDLAEILSDITAAAGRAALRELSKRKDAENSGPG